jgi:twitching motility protein PilT
MGATDRLDVWLATLVKRRASDLLLVSGVPPSLHVDGGVDRLDEPPLDATTIEEAVRPALRAHAAAGYVERGVADSSYTLDGVGRFRINLHRERGRPAATIRRLPSQAPLLEKLGLPSAVASLSRLPRGLILIAGPMVCGKTTTLTALVHDINCRERRHIITIEDPIEYEHVHDRSIVEQVEIGVDAPDFATALRAALRQAPDVLVLGEMRDPESMRIAVAAAETGHLVFSTIHSTDTVFTQQLVPRRGGGRIVASELLIVGYGARQHIRRNQLQHLHQEIAITHDRGSFSMEESLAQLFQIGEVDRDEVMNRATHQDMLKNLMG